MGYYYLRSSTGDEWRMTPRQEAEHEGWLAYFRHEGRDENPFREPELRNAWLIGWDRAMRWDEDYRYDIVGKPSMEDYLEDEEDEDEVEDELE